jgi:hypothetical protein
VAVPTDKHLVRAVSSQQAEMVPPPDYVSDIASVAFLFMDIFSFLFLVFIVTAGISIGALAAILTVVVLRMWTCMGNAKLVSTKKAMAISFVAASGLFYALAFYDLKCNRDSPLPFCSLLK